jgi:hypothetical protein
MRSGSPVAVDRLVTFLLDLPASTATDAATGADTLAATDADAIADPLAAELATWLAASTPFRRFVETHRDKIRKKLRISTQPDSRRDVRAELQVARLLLADRHVELAFEPAGAARGGPDFAVTYRGQPAFNLEVTRPRRTPQAAQPGPILPKLRQLPPGAPNLLLVCLGGTDAAAWDVAAAVRALRAAADARDEAFLTRHGFANPRAFYDRFLRLGGVVTWAEAAEGAGRAGAWINRSARSALPDRALRACLAALAA